MNPEPTAPEPTAPEPADPEPPDAEQLTPAERAARRRRLAEIFGDVLPDQTSDDADEPQPQPGGADEWLKRQVPPHHGQ